VKLSGRNVEYIVALGMDFFKLEQFEDARSQWQKAIGIDPNNAKAKKYLDIVQKKLGQ
jgi:Tfp pilus assembly protein PilF